MAVRPRPRRPVEEREDSAFVSVTDLTVSFLFVILVLLAFFATEVRPDEEDLQDGPEPEPLAAYLESTAEARMRLLEFIAERLRDVLRDDLPRDSISLDTANGIIRFRGDDLFDSGQWRVDSGSTPDRVARALADALRDTLPCYTIGGPPPDSPGDCEDLQAAEDAPPAIETIQIEGHTDNEPLSLALQEAEQMRDNLDLSSRRGAETLRAMTRYRPSVMDFLNLKSEPVLSVAGYGSTRPIDDNDAEAGRAANRRVDIRFILQTPQNLDEVQEIRNRLTAPREGLPPVVPESEPEE